MSFLFDIINALNDDEIARLKQMPLTGKEEEVLLMLLQERRNAEPGNEQISKLLNITNAHYNKIKSVLLDKALMHLAGGASLAIINFLAAKRTLPQLLQREILQQEKILVKQGTGKAEMYSYYLTCFEKYLLVPVKLFDAEFAETLAGKILKVSSSRQADKFDIDVGLMQVRLNMLSSKGGAHVALAQNDVAEQMQKLEDAATQLNTYRAKYKIKYLLGYYYQSMSETEKSLKCYKDIFDMFEEPGCDLPENLRRAVRLKQAEALYFCNNFKDAYLQYISLFNDYMPELKDDIYTKTKLLQVCIINEQYVQAQEILDKYMRHYLTTKGGSTHIMTALCYAKLYLCSGNIDEAAWHLDFLRIELNKNVYVQYEIELRNLENAYFFLKGDYAFARTLTKKNIKFLASKGFTMDNSGYGYFFHLINAFYNLYATGKKLNKEQLKMMDYCQDGSWKIYGMLLNNIMNKALSLK